jgi:hypothetical protein
MARKLLIGCALALVTAAAGFLAWRQLVKAGVLRYNEYDRRERGQLRVGASAPDLELPLYDGSRLRLSELWRARPAFLVFGSCT